MRNAKAAHEMRHHHLLMLVDRVRFTKRSMVMRLFLFFGHALDLETTEGESVLKTTTLPHVIG